MSNIDRVGSGSVNVDLSIDTSSQGATDVGDPDGASLLPEPGDAYWAISSGGDMGTEIAKLLLEGAYEDKTLSKETRALEEKAQRAAEDAQLKALEEEANKKLVAGLLGGAAMIGAGAAMNTGAEGTSKIIEGESKLMSAVFEHDAGMANVDATQQEQLAGRHERAADDARDASKDAGELIDRAIGYYKEYVTAKNDAQKAAIYRA